jgi:hypothetical protein
MRLTEKQVRALPIGTILYYNEYSPAEEKIFWDDIVQIVDKDEYDGPIFKILHSKLNKDQIGKKYRPDIFEISNGRAYAIPDKDFIVKLILDEDMM